MDDLIAFLNARLDDDEAYARQAFADHNNAGPDWSEIWSGAVNLGDEEDLLITNDSGVSRHIERQDPARVLADVAAKRQIIEMHERDTFGTQAYCRKCAIGDSCDDCLDYSTQVWPCSTLRLLALPFADHPDYREEWKP